MECSQAQDAIQLDLDGELAPPENLALQQHLAGCTVCREIARQHAGIRDGLRRLAATTPPADDARKTPLRVESETEHPEPTWVRGQDPHRRWAVAAAAMVALCIGGWWISAHVRRERAEQTVLVPPPKPVLPAPAAPPDPRSIVRVGFEPSSDMIAVPKPTRNPNITVLWVYPAIRTAEAKPSQDVEPDSDLKGAHS